MKIHRYLWPVWCWAFFQLNIFMWWFLGDFDSKFGNWLYGRDCNYGWCEGALLFLDVWCLFTVLFIGNFIYQWDRK